MKKLLTILLAICLLATMTIPAALAVQDATLSFAFWDKNQEPGMKAIADAYMAKNPNVKINIQVTPWDEYWTKLQAATAGNQMPDVLWMHSNQFMLFADAKTLLDLSDIGVDYTPYPEGITKLYNYQGIQYAVPKDYDTIALAYNKEIFDAANEPYPNDTWTWDTLREVAKKLTNPEKGIYGFAAPSDDQSGYLNFIYQNGGFEYKDGVCGYNLPETKEAIKAWTDLILVDKVSPSIESFADMNMNEQFQAGKLAMQFLGSWNMSTYTQNPSIKDKFDLAVLPMGKVRASIYNGLGYAASAITKYPEAAKDFIKFASSEEGNILQAQNKAAIPAYAGTEKYFVENFKNINIGCYPEMIAYGVQFPFSPKKSLWVATEQELVTAIYSGEFTVDQACDKIYETVTEIENEQ